MWLSVEIVCVSYLTWIYRYVEHTLKEKKDFDAQGILSQKESYKDRLRYWTDEMCKEEPDTFDIILAVGLLSLVGV